MDCSLPGFSVHGVFQARILEWVAVSYSRGSSRPRDRTCISCTGRQILYHCATWEVLSVVGTCPYDGTITDWWLGYVTQAQLALRKGDHAEWTQSVYPSKGTGLEEGDTRCGCLHFSCGDSTLLVLEMEEGWGREREHSLRAQVVSWTLRNSHLSPTHKALNCANMWMSLEADSFLECWSSMLKMFFNLG